MSTFETFINPHARVNTGTHDIQGDPFGFHAQFPGYEPTPLVASPLIADRLKVASVVVKYEHERFGLPAFKMLGAAWATFRAVADWAGVDFMSISGFDELIRSAHTMPQRLVAATDGNHGQAVARLASMLEIDAHIWVPSYMSAHRIAMIEDEGAVVHVVGGSYDLAVATAAAQGSDHAIVVSDTAWPGYEQVPAWVIDGYSTIFLEMEMQLTSANHRRPTLVPLPIGVGGLATAAAIHYRNHPHVKLIGVEPTNAACALAALQAGRVVPIETGTTAMVGLNCGTLSTLAYPRLAAGLHSTVTIDDIWAEEAIALYEEAGFEVGASGAATLGSLLALTSTREGAGRVPSSTDTILLIATEAANDHRVS